MTGSGIFIGSAGASVPSQVSLHFTDGNLTSEGANANASIHAINYNSAGSVDIYTRNGVITNTGSIGDTGGIISVAAGDGDH